MTSKNDIRKDDAGNTYLIKIKGHLDDQWSDWLGGLEITQDGHGNSLLRGRVRDQAALHGILAQIRDLGLTLISIMPKDTNGESIEGESKNVERGSK